MIDTKMTSIADKIRSLLGITEKMGLDSMATNLETEQANIESAFSAVGSKGGTIPESKTSGNLSSAIESISTGINVQKKNGSFTTNSSGTASVDCGFKPDAVLIKGKLSGNVASNLAAIFAEDTRSTIHRGYMWVSDSQSTYQQYKMDITQKESGFSVVAYDHYWYAEDKASDRRSFDYVAVKYTA